MSVGFSMLYRSSHPMALERSLIEQIQKEKGLSPMAPLFVIVPNNYIGAHLKHELALKKAHINIIFETIEGFAHRLLSPNAEFLNKKRLTPETELFLIGKIAQENLQNTELENIAGKTGFHKNLKSFFHHLISSQSSTIPSINTKTKFFNTLFSKYLSIKSTHYHGLWNIEQASKTELNINASVFIYGFSQFTKLEQNFLTTVAKFSNLKLWIEIFSSDKFQESTFMWLDNVFQNVEDLEVPDTSSTSTIQPCHHFEDETLWIAQTIQERQKAKPISFHRIGIFLNDYNAQEPILRKALTQQNIPSVSIRGRKYKETRFGMSFKTLIDLLLTHWNRSEWFNFLQSFPFKASIYEKNGSPVEWNDISVRAFISNRDSFFIERLVHYSTKNKNAQIFSFVEFQEKILKEFTNLEKLLRLDKLSFVNSLNHFLQEYADPKELTPNVLLFLDELEYMCSEICLAPSRDILNLILEKLENTYFTERTFESDGVLIAPISMMKSMFFDIIFLPHMNEGLFPKHAERSFDLHPDEIKQISSSSPIRFSHVTDQFDEQSSWFESARNHCTQSLNISYSMYGLPKEEDLKPSIFLYGQKKEPVFVAHPTVAENFSPTLRQQVQKWIENTQSQTWNEFNAFLDTKFISKDIYSASELSRYATCPKQYFLNHILGLSMEDYLETQFQMMSKDKGKIVHEILFRFFTQMNRKGWIPFKKEQRMEMQNALIHIAKEACKHYRTFGSYGITNLWNIDEEEFLSNLMEYLDREIQESSYWIPYSFEHRFGMKKFQDQEDDEHSTEQPLKLNLSQKSLLFKGKIDRIDFSADKTRLRITDYKTGHLGDRKSWGYDKGTQLQIPLYVLLADQFSSGTPLQEVNGKLVSIQAISKFEERNVTRSEILTKQDEIFSHFEMIDQGIKAGNFFPNPNGGENCKYCDFKNICGSSIVQIVEETEETPFMTSYHESKKALP